MKKLMFATALVASVAAFADAPTALNAVGFEGYALGYTPQTGETEKNEDGTDKTEAGYGYFYFDGGEGGASNSSVVTNETPSTTETKRTAYFAEETNTKFLALDTEGGTFWRCLNEISHSGDPVTYGLGAVTNVAATGTYLDTLVQFTVTEDDEPTVGENDKLAIWLGVETNSLGEVIATNLMVKAGSYDDEGTLVGGGSYVLSGKTILPGEWYRLTIKAVDDIFPVNTALNENFKIPGFQIFIDSDPVFATGNPISTAFVSMLVQAELLTAEQAAVLNSGAYLPSLLAGTPGTASTLQGVGFQGTGAVDEIVWTEDDLFPAGGPTVVDYTFTLTLGANVTGAAVTTNGAAVVFDNGTAQILAGTTVSIAEPTFAQGYQLNTITTNDTAVVDPQFPLSFTMDAAMTVAITSELIPVTYPTYVGEDATLKTQYDTWKNGKTVGDGESYEKQFLLNTATDTVVADDALQIDSITEVQGGWDIVVSTTVTGAALSDGSATTYNGYLLVKSADTLAGLEAATPASYTVTPAADGKVKITVTAGKFMKVVLTTTAPAQN